MNLSSLLKDLGGAAEKIVPLIAGSAGGAPAAVIGLAHAVQAAISSAKAIHTGPATPEADKASKELFAVVSEHARSTFDRADNG